jgi:Fe-S-cluster-containing dehydrogenase component
MADFAMNRRGFLKGALAAAGATVALKPGQAAASGRSGKARAMMIDLTNCDGCPGKGTAACVTACRTENQARFPVPEKPIKDYWPQKKHEDWSDKKGLTTTLTPYNWTAVQRVEVEQEGRQVTVNVPRHCMHCDDPACVKFCPVGANTKRADGAVCIDPELCLGGAKCRDVCPWGIPQRQAGVGVYLNFDPALGGGVLYKCDFCASRADKGQEPACVEACRLSRAERGGAPAVVVGNRDEIVARAKARAAEVGGHVYGLEENGGTSVIYVSTVPFEKIDAALVARKDRFRMPRVKNRMYENNAGVRTLLAAPVAGLVAGLALAGKTFVKTAKQGDARKEVDGDGR